MGCNSGGGDSAVTDEGPTQLNGVFVDSPVEGLYYERSSHDEYTDANGMFSYMEEDTIAFFIGDVMLGQAPAMDFMIPLHLVEGAVDETHPAFTNIGRLIQTLYIDGNPDNGVTIPLEAEDVLMGKWAPSHR